jgi:hypothetical protein
MNRDFFNQIVSSISLIPEWMNTSAFSYLPTYLQSEFWLIMAFGKPIEHPAILCTAKNHPLQSTAKGKNQLPAI